MARPLTPEQLIRALDKFDVRYRQLDGWRTHNRNAVGAWGPVNGLIVHHTGDDAPDPVDRRIIRDGRAGLPGPLAQFGLNDDGVLDLIGWGRANHAGGGDPRVLERVIAEDYGRTPPAPREHTGSAGAVDGNSRFYGVETYYSGKARPTAKAYDTLVRLSAAILDAHGWGAKSVIGHKEWSDWKIDPGSVDMVRFREDVATMLATGGKPSKPTRAQRAARRRAIARRLSVELDELLDEAVKRGRVYRIRLAILALKGTRLVRK